MLQRIKKFWFQGAGRFAAPEIRSYIEKFRQLPEVKRGEINLLFALLGDGTPPYKFSKSEVFYVDDARSLKPGQGANPQRPYEVPYAKGMTCMNCNSYYLHVVTSTGICDRMKGVVEDEGWCNRWNPPISAARYRRYQDLGNAGEQD